jgi:hypothetical protein
MDTALHGGFNDTNGGLVLPWRPEISLVWFGVVSATSGASDHGYDGCLWTCLCMAVSVAPTAAVSDLGG